MFCMILSSFLLFFCLFCSVSDGNSCFSVKKLISISERRALACGAPVCWSKFKTVISNFFQVLGSRSSARAVSFLYALLAWNPSWRSTAQEALKHSYFRNAKSNNPGILANNHKFLNPNPIIKIFYPGAK